MKLLAKRRQKIGLIVGVVIALCGLLVGGLVIWHSNSPAQHVVTTPANIQVPAPNPISTRSSALFFGNAYWGRYINDWSMASPLKTAYPFSRLNEFKRDNYDAWIAGLECPSISNFSQTSAEEDATLSFNCSPTYLPEAAKWFTAFTLANNHTDNRGVDGFAETKQHLEENKIQYFGHPDPDQLKDVCEVIAFPVKVTLEDKTTKERSLPVAMCGYAGVFKIPSQESLAVMEQYSKLMPVIAMPHMGVEYKPAPDQLKTETYRSMIDHGADMVLGDHPHWIQPSESYKGHLIVYSMGNFMFDQQDTPEVVRSAAINVVMSTQNADAAELSKWLDLGDSCRTFHDDCLSKIKTAGLTKLAINYQFGVIGTNDSAKITKPATADQLTGILQRLNWANTMKQLQAPYSSL
jgi:hypothetical protein